MAFCCPKSVRACALRVTRLNSSGVPLDPLTANSRIQTAGFVELAVAPKYEDGKADITRWGNDETGMVMVVDRDFDVLLGLDIKLKLCGVPTAVLEMMLGANLLSDEAGITGVILKDDKRFACRDPLMLEVWSRNIANQTLNADGTCDNWIHWVVPLTNYWTLDSDLAFNNGTVEVALKGFGSSSPGWYPSAPDPAGGFDSYVGGWPTGPAPVDANPLVEPDSWTLSDLSDIRAGGPLAWKCVGSLPAPLDDCGYTPIPSCVELEPFTQSFVASSGEPPSPPWEVPDPFAGAPLPQFTPLGAVVAENFQIGSAAYAAFDNGCACPGHAPVSVQSGTVRRTETGFATAPTILRWERAGSDVGTMFYAASWTPGDGWAFALNIADWTTPDGLTPSLNLLNSHSVASSIVPMEGDDYRVEVTYDVLNSTAGVPAIVSLFINNSLVGAVAWGGMAGLGAGLGHLLDEYAPACYPVGVYGSAADTSVSMFITVTDLGNDQYVVLADDPNQCGWVSDPAGPVNNDGGLGGQCLPSGTGMPCATDPTYSVAVRQTLTVVSDASTRDFTLWLPNIISVPVDAPSGAGYKVATTYDLSDDFLAVNCQTTGGYIASVLQRYTFAQWVTDFGSGTTVEIKPGSATPVECLANFYPLGDTVSLPTGFGFFLVPDAFVPVPMSPVTSFEIGCGISTPVSAPVVWPSWTPPA